MKRAKIIGSLITALVFVSVFGLVGRWDWPRGWALIGLLLVGRLIAAPYLWRKNPELMKRRGQIGEGTKTWDLIVLTLFGVTFLAIPIVAALDIRYRWSAMSLWFWLVGAALYAFFVAIVTWSMAVNPFFEKTVRIQGDRGHQVIDSGPYGMVRHPGYLAIILGLVLAMPLLLGSWWAFVPAVLCTLTLILRTALEDRTLQKELPGYEAYTQKVRYKLIPGLW
ncbi:isoprenylcysteine carboxylmethyltransferase family protein [Nodosilinea sp. LEGE 07088]|uniref:methyltransferase family protein n=1 Tax=Nodosilinea sp. LEGE 07088 TaxID=2777968 RepID=UPI0018820C4B|nr:isoprenylcysteine carboxylmethyltransferase family protein [Nodosilinea sp. LEGE 07088]MBE9137067.1 isoprenylcysteine carboxylmethyltransferase family protein [Nodosilinea sp. LEGE 07088]